MTNLTEQWKKGELPSGWYYIKGGDGEIYPAENCPNYDYINDKVDNQFYYTEDEIEEIIDKVPSYEEWQDVEDDLATCDEDLNNVCEQKEELYEENAQLKELLKEANNWLKAFYAYEQSDFVREQVKQCLSKINQVLGEE